MNQMICKGFFSITVDYEWIQSYYSKVSGLSIYKDVL